MASLGIQKRGTGRAVKKMSLGGALAIKSKSLLMFIFLFFKLWF